MQEGYSSESGMYYGAPHSIFQKARFLRDNLTKTESILWERLRKNKLGVIFRRQHPINVYIADFYCHQMKLVVEIDGEYHNKPGQIEKDTNRNEDLESLGIEVIRFTDDQVINEVDIVIDKIKEEINHSTPNP